MVNCRLWKVGDEILGYTKENCQFSCNFNSKFSFQLLKKVRFDANVTTQELINLQRRSVMKKCFFVALLTAVCTIFMVGCSKPPPISVTFRGSLLDSSKVMQITNRSGNETIVAKVRVQRWKGDRKIQEASHIVKIGPGDTVELGRLEMGWAFVGMDFVIIEADDYDKWTFHVP